MLVRQVPACTHCPYKPLDIQLSETSTINGKKLNIFDVDWVIEVGKRIEAIAELKKYSDAAAYRFFEVPAHELVGYKKVAKSLRCDLYLIIFDGYHFYLAEVDRFSKHETVISYGKRVVRFPREIFKVLTESELQAFFLEKYG